MRDFIIDLILLAILIFFITLVPFLSYNPIPF